MKFERSQLRLVAVKLVGAARYHLRYKGNANAGRWSDSGRVAEIETAIDASCYLTVTAWL